MGTASIARRRRFIIGLGFTLGKEQCDDCKLDEEIVEAESTEQRSSSATLTVTEEFWSSALTWNF